VSEQKKPADSNPTPPSNPQSAAPSGESVQPDSATPFQRPKMQAVVGSAARRDSDSKRPRGKKEKDATRGQVRAGLPAQR
jgi:hypothetical protein